MTKAATLNEAHEITADLDREADRLRKIRDGLDNADRRLRAVRTITALLG